MKRRLLVGVAVVCLALATVAVLAGLPPSDGSASEPAGQEPAVSLHGDVPLELEQPEPVVSGTTELDGETELRVVIEDDGGEGTEPFYAPTEVTVEAGGNFTAAFDIDGVEVGREATVRVYSVGTDELLAERDAVVTLPWADIEPGESVVTFGTEEPISVDPADGTVSGTAAAEPGTELSVTLYTPQDIDAAFFMAETTVVDEDGEFEVEFDLSDVDSETEVVIEVLTADGAVAIGEFEGTVTEPSEPPATEEQHPEEFVELDETEPLELVPGNTSVAGTAEQLDAGDELEIRLDRTGIDGPDELPIWETATVGDDGAFVVDLDLRDVEPGVTVQFTVVHPEGTTAETFEAVILDPEE